MKTRTITTALAMLALSTSTALAAPAQDNAITVDGKPVVTSSGDCVRTQWMSENDACGIEPAPAPAAKAPVKQAQKIALEQRTVYFGFNEAVLSTEGKAKLESLVDIVMKSKGVQSATVIGYADEIGNKEANVILSQKRADAVRTYIDSHATIPTSVLIVNGKGATDSKTDCPSSMKRTKRIECLAADRRVEVEFNYAE